MKKLQSFREPPDEGFHSRCAVEWLAQLRVSSQLKSNCQTQPNMSSSETRETGGTGSQRREKNSGRNVPCSQYIIIFHEKITWFQQQLRRRDQSAALEIPSIFLSQKRALANNVHICSRLHTRSSTHEFTKSRSFMYV